MTSQDESSKLSEAKKVKLDSQSSIVPAAVQNQHETQSKMALEHCFDCDLTLSLAGAPRPLTAGVAKPKAQGKARARATSATLVEIDDGEEIGRGDCVCESLLKFRGAPCSCDRLSEFLHAWIGHTVLSKAKLSACKDPVLASTKARKFMLKSFNQTRTKIEQAVSASQQALDEIYSDYDSQDSSIPLACYHNHNP